MLRALIEIFFLYLLYKLIFDFIIPVYQTTKQVKQKVNKMQQDMNEHIQRQNNQFNPDANKKEDVKASRKTSEDYIDFEEVK